MTEYVAFYPRLKGKKRRAKFMVKACDIPRGRDASGVIHTAQTITGSVIRYRIVACNLPDCFCDAQLVDIDTVLRRGIHGSICARPGGINDQN